MVDRSHAQQAYHLIRDWLTTGSFDPPQATPTMLASGVEAVRVTLRSSGLTMGAAQALVTLTYATPQDQDALQHPVDLVPLLRQATRIALKDAQDKAHTLQSRAAITQDPSGENKPTVDDLATRLQIDLQIAHTAEPLELTENDGTAAVCQRFIPGYHGLRAVVKPNADHGPTTAIVWPATALAANMSPPSQVRRLLADLGLGEDQLNQLILSRRVSLQRFSVLHVVQPGPGQPPVVLERGHEVIPTTRVSDQLLEDMADRLTAFLLERKRPDGHWSGTYHPSIDRYDPAIAPIDDLSLVAFVLGRRANFLNDTDRSDHPEARDVTQARDTAVDTLRRALLHNADPSRARSNPAAAALLLLTLLDSQELTAKHKADRDALAKRLLSIRRDDGGFTASDVKGAPAVNRPTQALIVAALASLYEQTRDQKLGAQVLASSQLLWQDAQPTDVISALPWLAMAEFKLRTLSHTFDHADADDGRWLQATLALAKAVDVLRDHLIRTTPPSSPGDVIGGFDLSPATDALSPDPDWRSAHMLTFLALALGQEQLAAGQDRLDWLLDCGLASRFLAQLMVHETGCYYMRSQSDAIGAVSMKLWDNRLGVAPAAMTLLAVTELQRQIKAIK